MTNFFHWFVVGIVLAILETRKNPVLPYKLFGKLFAIFSLFAFFGSAYYAEMLLVKIFQPLLLFVFLYGVLIQGYFVKWLSLELFTIIGGACYIVYLIHFQVISVSGHFFISFIESREFLSLLLLITTPLICLLAFPILERPFMKRNWWKFKSPLGIVKSK